MTDNAGVPSPVIRRPVATAHVRSSDRWRHPPGWLWPLVIALQVGSALSLTAYTYFLVDDFLFQQQARVQAFGWPYLLEPLFEHFSPVTRALNAVLVNVAPGNFAVAHGIQLALYAASVAAFALVARTILGNSWTALAVTGIFGQSLFLMRLLAWWTATANILPATCLVLVAFAGYLRWQKGCSRLWIGASVMAFALSLLDYETAMLFPFYLALVRFLVIEDKLDPRAWLAGLWHEKWIWLSYGMLDAVAFIHYINYYYYPAVRPGAGQLLHYLEIALVEGFVPALAGVKSPQGLLSGYAAVIFANLLVIAGVVVTLYLRPRAWRCVAAFVLVFFVTMTPVGLNRIHQWGVGIGAELNYQQSLHYMFLVLVAFALSSRWGGRRASAGAPACLLPIHRQGASFLAVAGVAIVVGYSALYVSSARAIADATWEPHYSRAYVSTFLASVDRVRVRTGWEPVLIDLNVPHSIMPAVFAPYNRYDQFFPLVDRNLRVDEIADPVFVVMDSGQLAPVRFAASADGVLNAATVSATDGSGVVPAARDAALQVCVPAGRSVSRLHIPLSVAQTVAPRSNELPYGIRVRYSVPYRVPVNMLLDNAHAITLDTEVDRVWGPGAGGELAPVTVRQQVDEVAFDLPGGSCVTDLAVGLFDYSGPPA